MSSLKNISRSSVHFWVYYLSLCLLAVALPSSKYFITIALLLLIVNWIAEGRFRYKFRLFLANKPALAFSLIYCTYLLGLLWSMDFHIALNYDLLHKSPSLFMPVIFASSPVPDRKKITGLLLLFLSSLLIVTIIGLVSRLLTVDIDNTWRKGSPFMPGIYFGIMLVLGTFQLPDLLRKITVRKEILLAGLLISAWLVFYLLFIRALSGIASLSAVAVYMLYIFFTGIRNGWVKMFSVVFVLLLIFFALYPLKSIYEETHKEVDTDLTALDQYTSSGNPYFHDRGRIIRENGNLVYIYICETELSEEWNRRSELDFDGLDLRGWDVKHTLYRYMASMGLRKDRDGFSKLSDDDIRAVEKGIANYRNVGRPGIYIRAYEEMMGMYIYRKSSYKSPTWGSLSERIDTWKASLLAFKKKPLLGWGTGSILDAMDYGFRKNNSSLAGQNRRPHSQYLYILLTQGIIGLIVFLALLSYIIVKSNVYRYYIFKVFLIIFAVNFLANNSLENQLGQNIFVFFMLFYIFFYPVLDSGSVKK